MIGKIRDINRIVKTYNRNIYVDVYLFPPLMKWRDSSCIRMQTFANNTARESRVEHTACKSRKYHTAQQVLLSSCHGCRSTDPRPLGTLGIHTVEPYDGAYLENNRSGTAPGLAERCIPAAVSAAVPCLSCRMEKKWTSLDQGSRWLI